MKITFTYNPTEDNQESFDEAIALFRKEQQKGKECEMYLATFTGKRVLLVDGYVDVEAEGGALIAVPKTWYNQRMFDELGLHYDDVK